MTETLNLINIDDISPNPYQPRLEFKQEELEELSRSIKANGLIQPIIVRKSAIFGYELIAGERRLKASKMAGLSEIPAIIKEISNKKSMQLAIVENLQRSDLNPIEEAKAYQQLLDRNQMTHEELAQFMGKSRPYITNCLRLLNLPSAISKAVERGQLSQGHARVLLTLKNEKEQEKWYQKVITEEISVRKLEELVKKSKPTKKSSKKNKKNIFIRHQEEELSKLLGVPVSLSLAKSGFKGDLQLHFQSEEDFNRIINRLK
ncbi:ParB/RepB/Spo0J family partition protein [Streptococcus equinus]|uniref:ParB/RepB/Spo0J family partition protein n=1 Tax=Streptococcus equinus TaxID=1335 RepID=UPI0015F539E4|nr:ParB/RepB/Spo0J family partition protein [Streptococcus equinus]QMS96357.1 ParB/RepB/Spo0J family partition protein [Streptococcus equinus]